MTSDEVYRLVPKGESLDDVVSKHNIPVHLIDKKTYLFDSISKESRYQMILNHSSCEISMYDQIKTSLDENTQVSNVIRKTTTNDFYMRKFIRTLLETIFGDRFNETNLLGKRLEIQRKEVDEKIDKDIFKK